MRLRKILTTVLVIALFMSPVHVFAVAYNIADGVFSQFALSVSVQESTPNAMLFNDDGTKLYVLGAVGDDINEYTLSTPYDISSGTFTKIALSVAGQEGIPTDMIFNNTGTKLYVMGSAGDDINEYTLSTPYDISSGTFTKIALSVAGQEDTPRSLVFNNDGTKLYVTGTAGDDINEYTLSTPYDINSGTFARIALSFSAQEAVPTDMIFNNDGTKLYVTGTAGDDINEYTLSTPYDINSGTFTKIALSVAGQEGAPTDMIFNNDGTKLYVLGSGDIGVHEYHLIDFTALSGSGGGRRSKLTASCVPSKRNIVSGDIVSFEISIDTTEDAYNFKWTKVLEGDDEDATYAFSTPGTFYPRGEVRTTTLGAVVANCGTITVIADDNDTENDRSDDTDGDSDSDDTNTTTVETTQASPRASLTEIVMTYKDFLLSLRALGIPLSPEVNTILDTLTAPAGTTIFTKDLELGDNDPDVRLLQQFLNANGYTIASTGSGSPGNETTIFGYATQTALIRFQQANNITPAAGYFGSVTRGVVNSLQ